MTELRAEPEGPDDARAARDSCRGRRSPDRTAHTLASLPLGAAETAGRRGYVKGSGPIPDRLGARLAELRRALPAAKDEQDRRGFRLLTWPGLDGAPKPTECSLEHEAHLAPTDRGIGPLLTALHFSEGRAAGELLVPRDHPIARSTVVRYARPPGPQSVDIYLDLRGGEIVATGHTLRIRETYASHMTWNGADGLQALNAELPSVVLDADCGLVARLEFNWFGEPGQALSDPLGDPTNPLTWLARSVGTPNLAAAAPATRQETVRLKFGLREGADDPATERLVINIDFITATLLHASSVPVRWVDVDVSSVRFIDDDELAALRHFATMLASRYALRPTPRTKIQGALAQAGQPPGSGG